MKKNILILSIISLFAITISYTYSAFKNTIKGTITATTNNWKFSVSVTGGVKENDYYKVPINSTSGSFNIVLNNVGSKYYAKYTIELEKVNLPDNFVLNDTLYEGTLINESKTISVSYSSSSSVNGYILVKTKAISLEYSFMKNGNSQTSSDRTEFWSDTYRPYIRIIYFENDLSNLPSSCTASNLCWDISENDSQRKKVYGYLVDSGEKDSGLNVLYNLYIVSNNDIYAPSDSAFLFYSFSCLTNINFNNNFDTSNVVTMESMFDNCLNLTSVDLSGFDTTNVTNIERMFFICSSLTELDLSSFSTINIITMKEMFGYCNMLTSLDLSIFNTSNVTTMESMFSNCNSLISINLSSFDTSKVTNMSGMFSNCESLMNINLSDFNTSKVTKMFKMFYECYELMKLDLSNFNTINVTDMSSMFYKCLKLTELDINSFNTSNVTDMNNMFYSCSDLTSLNLSSFNTSKVTDMGNMFSLCSSLTELNLSSFNTSKVTDMSSMFYKCLKLTELSLSSFNTSNVMDMGSMFSNCESLINLDLSNFNTSNVTSMQQIFEKSSVLITTINIMSSSIKYYYNMFYGAATASEAKITVNYISTASTLVDNMLTKKSSNSNVVKGTIIPEYTIAISGNTDITYESSNRAKGTSVNLVSTSGNYYVTSFKMNGTFVEGNTFIMPNGNVTITDITTVACTTFETAHNPYLNSQSNVIIGEQTFEGATSLTVILDYQTEGIDYDYFNIYDSASSTTGINYNKKYGGNTRTKETITINGNYIKITFTSDSGGNTYYGMKATIIPNY